MSNTIRQYLVKILKMLLCFFISYLQEDWDFLQLQCALYINSEMSGIPLSMQVCYQLISQSVSQSVCPSVCQLIITSVSITID